MPDVDNRRCWLNQMGRYTHVVTDIMYRRSLIDRASATRCRLVEYRSCKLPTSDGKTGRAHVHGTRLASHRKGCLSSIALPCKGTFRSSRHALDTLWLVLTARNPHSWNTFSVLFSLAVVLHHSCLMRQLPSRVHLLNCVKFVVPPRVLLFYFSCCIFPQCACVI